MGVLGQRHLQDSATDVQPDYILGELKNPSCPTGFKKIMNKAKCIEGLEYTGKEPRPTHIFDDHPCYINGNDKGLADGEQAAWAKYTLICAKISNPTKATKNKGKDGKKDDKGKNGK